MRLELNLTLVKDSCIFRNRPAKWLISGVFTQCSSNLPYFYDGKN